jgi:hypothetical protein
MSPLLIAHDKENKRDRFNERVAIPSKVGSAQVL